MFAKKPNENSFARYIFYRKIEHIFPVLRFFLFWSYDPTYTKIPLRG